MFAKDSTQWQTHCRHLINSVITPKRFLSSMARDSSNKPSLRLWAHLWSHLGGESLLASLRLSACQPRGFFFKTSTFSAYRAQVHPLVVGGWASHSTQYSSYSWQNAQNINMVNSIVSLCSSPPPPPNRFHCWGERLPSYRNLIRSYAA